MVHRDLNGNGNANKPQWLTRWRPSWRPGQRDLNGNANEPCQQPSFGSILPDIFAFTFGIASAWILKWKTTDLIWSLWLCSLAFGHLTFLSIVALMIVEWIKAMIHKARSMTHKARSIVGLLLTIAASPLLFLQGGFLLWLYCLFHAGHASVLSMFFPLEGLSPDAFLDEVANPIWLWKTVFEHLLMNYGLFLIPAIIAERRYVFAPVIAYIRFLKDRKRKSVAAEPKEPVPDPLEWPFMNLIRMHFLIFFFAFFHWLGLESFLVFAVVYAVYFFPWKALGEKGE